MKPLTLADATERAHDAGLTVQLLAGVEQTTSKMLLALRSGDSDSELHLVKGAGYFQDEIPLAQRSQSGPERWDYSLAIPELRDRFLLRLTRAQCVRDVPLLSGTDAILHTHGWTDNMSLLGEPVVSPHHFHQALEELAMIEQA